MSERISVECKVAGRPTGHASGGNKQRWRAAVRHAFVGVTLPGAARIQVEAGLVLAVQQRGRPEPDLDNLIKFAFDALEGVLSERSCAGARLQAGDGLVNRTVAPERRVRDGEQLSARVSVSKAAEKSPLEPVRTCMMGRDSYRGKP